LLLRSALFWDIRQRRVLFTYRRFGTTSQSHFQGWSSPRRMFGPWRWDLLVVPEPRYLHTILHCRPHLHRSGCLKLCLACCCLWARFSGMPSGGQPRDTGIAEPTQCFNPFDQAIVIFV